MSIFFDNIITETAFGTSCRGLVIGVRDLIEVTSYECEMGQKKKSQWPFLREMKGGRGFEGLEKRKHNAPTLSSTFYQDQEIAETIEGVNI